MLINIQFPMIDLRAADEDASRTLIRDNVWELDTDLETFIPNLGAITERKEDRYLIKSPQHRSMSEEVRASRRMYLYGFPEKMEKVNRTKKIRLMEQEGEDRYGQEHIYFRARKLIKFPTLQKKEGKEINLTCIFRRMFMDGEGLNRFDLGFFQYLQADTDLEKLQEELFNLEVKIKPAKAKVNPEKSLSTVHTELYKAGKQISKKFLIATTRHDSYELYGIKPVKHLLTTGDPIAVFILDKTESNYFKWITDNQEYSEVAKSEVTNHHYRIYYRSHRPSKRGLAPLDAWYILSENSVEGEDSLMRYFRMKILRLHAEKLAIRNLLKVLVRRKEELNFFLLERQLYRRLDRIILSEDLAHSESPFDRMLFEALSGEKAIGGRDQNEIKISLKEFDYKVYQKYFEAPSSRKAKEGYIERKTYLLPIGVSFYRDYKIPNLYNASLDASQIADLLQTYYGCKILPEAYALYNEDATREGLNDRLKALAYHFHKKPEGERDNLIIYFAGHGLWNSKLKEAFWVLQGPGGKGTDLYHDTLLLYYLNRIKPHHCLVISDSCFAGDLSESMRVSLNEGLQAETYGKNPQEVKRSLVFDKKVRRVYPMEDKPSRYILASGLPGQEVSDGIRDDHSPFAKGIISFIEDRIEREQKDFNIFDLYAYIHQNFENSDHIDQRPFLQSMPGAPADEAGRGRFWLHYEEEEEEE